MFNKIKKIKKLKELEGRLREEKVEVEEKGVKVVVNGKMEVEALKLNAEISLEEEEKVLKSCLNKAMREIQMRVARKMSEISEFDF